MFDLNLEQPIFGANYIKGKVRGEQNSSNFLFKLKFNQGGAIELGQAMSNAARIASEAAKQMQFQPPPVYTATASAYYQAPDNVFQPSYPIGFVLPTNIYPDAPPPGFIYTTQAPPPYPGLNTLASQQPPPMNATSGAYPSYPTSGFAGPQSYPQAGAFASNAGYPQSTGYTPQPGFQSTGYPSQQPGFQPVGNYSQQFAGPVPSAPEFPPTYDEATKKEK